MSNYYEPSVFFKNNKAYADYTDKFDALLNLFNESEKLKDIVTAKSKFTNWEQMACSFIFLRCQESIISIMKLCNEGNQSDARILTRSLYEFYIHHKYIIKTKTGRMFVLFHIIAMKRFIDDLENKYPDKELVESTEYAEFKKELIENYEKIKDKFIISRGSDKRKTVKWSQKIQLRRNWSPKSLREMAESVGDKRIHHFVMSNYSSNVHCDIFALSHYLKEFGDKIEFDNAPKSENMNDILELAIIFFGAIVARWLNLLNIEVRSPFSNYLLDTDKWGGWKAFDEIIRQKGI